MLSRLKAQTCLSYANMTPHFCMLLFYQEQKDQKVLLDYDMIELLVELTLLFELKDVNHTNWCIASVATLTLKRVNVRPNEQKDYLLSIESQYPNDPVQSVLLENSKILQRGKAS